MDFQQTIRAPQHVRTLLDKLHKESSEQEASIPQSEYNPIKALFATDPETASKKLDALMLDKFIALDVDKAAFVYQLILSTRSTYVVEAGTSFGVSTIYLALAVAEVEERVGKKGKVIGTEKEVEKAERARAHWKECGEVVESRIDLRVGDLVETLAKGLQEVDMLLLDIWPPVALPALNAVLPKLKPGAIVLTDNTISSGPRYQELLSVLRNPDGDFRSTTLPFNGGFEMSVYMPKQRVE